MILTYAFCIFYIQVATIRKVEYEKLKKALTVEDGSNLALSSKGCNQKVIHSLHWYFFFFLIGCEIVDVLMIRCFVVSKQKKSHLEKMRIPHLKIFFHKPNITLIFVTPKYVQLISDGSWQLSFGAEEI